MTNPCRDQEKFMRACDQTVEGFNQEQFKLYVNLIDEEFNELNIEKGASVELYYAFGVWYIVSSDGLKQS